MSLQRPKVKLGPQIHEPEHQESSDSESDNDDFNKTLPPNFKFCQAMMQSPTRASPIRSFAHSTKQRSTTIQRRQPVAPGSKPSLSRYKKNTLGKSDPALARNNLLSPEDSYEEEVTEPIRRDSLR